MHAPPAINRTMSPLQWALLITLSILWGGSFFFNEVAVRELPPLTVVTVRVALAAAILWLIVVATRAAMPTSRAIWGAFLVMGLVNNAIPFALIVWGQTAIASGVAAIINATTPLFTVIVAHIATRDERMTVGGVIGVLLGLLGVATTMGGGLAGGPGGSLFAYLACIGAAISYAVAGVYGRRFARLGVPPMATATGQVTGSTLILLPLMLLADQPWLLPMPSLQAIGALIGLASVSTAFGYLIYFRILGSSGATNLLLVTILAPVSAVFLGIGILGEILLPRHIAGLGLIVVGLLAIDGRPWRAARRAFAG